MALKDIFNMIKADRYTADGCEEIKKSQEAIAKDAGLPDGTMRHRKDGDYIKQAGKWVPAKKGNGGAKKAGKPEAGKPASAPSLSKAERQDAMAKQRFDSVKEGDQVTAYGSKVKIVKKYPGSNSIDVEFKDSKGEKQISHLSILDIDDNSFTKKGTESKPANKPKVPSPDDLDWAKGVASRNNVKAEDLIKNGTALKPGVKVSFNTPRDGDLSGEIIDIAGYDGKAFVTVSTPKGNRTIATEKVVTDSAPRILTGDCKIRIRKETTDGGLPDGSVSHRKDGDYIKKAGKWVPAPSAKGKAGKSPANKPDKVGDFLRAYERGDFGKYQQNAEQKKAESFFKEKGTNNDAAPRQLTGDCKIRIRKR